MEWFLSAVRLFCDDIIYCRVYLTFDGMCYRLSVDGLISSYERKFAPYLVVMNANQR